MRQGKSLGLWLLCALSTLSMAAVAPAQEGATLEVGTGLVPGGQVTVSYSSPEAGGQSVLVVVDDGGDQTQWDYVIVQLDERGRGSAKWTVPSGWIMAVFSATGAQSVTRAVDVSGTE